uniref:Uncharacterized protein n=1 Tax=Anguilla anguilla TaxID=7936 RepID=A0A0E9XDD6_ANGAN
MPSLPCGIQRTNQRQEIRRACTETLLSIFSFYFIFVLLPYHNVLF